MDAQRIKYRKLIRKPNNDDLPHFFYAQKCGDLKHTSSYYYLKLGQIYKKAPKIQ